MPKILYSAYVLTSKGKEAISNFVSDLPNKYGHHCTIQFAPTHTVDFAGWICNIKAVGRLKTELVDCLIITQDSLPTKSKNVIAHITLSTAEGVKPFMSNSQIAAYPDKVEYFDTPIDIETVITDIMSS